MEIFQLREKGDLNILVAHSTQKEVEHPNTPEWVKKEAGNLVYTMEVGLNPNEGKMFRRIHEILTGDGKLENVVQDAQHIFEAQKYGSYFVTTDDRLLKKADDIRQACRVEIKLPSEFLEIVRSYDR